MSETTGNSTLQQVHLIFRHGDRTPDHIMSYPSDPYKDEKYEPYGVGELTNAGKRTMYTLGQSLRQRYGDFVGDYRPDIVEEWCTTLNRAQCSLQIVNAGLFPPDAQRKWNEKLLWQPIPYKINHDHRFIGVTLASTFIDRLLEYMDTEEFKRNEEQFQDIFEQVTKYSDTEISDSLQAGLVRIEFEIREEFGLKVPEWSKLLNERKEALALNWYKTFLATTEMKRMMSGFLLEKMISDIKDKLFDESKTKMYIYSAHDVDVACILSVLKLKIIKEMPKYGSCVHVQVHKINDKYGLKVYYQECPLAEPLLMKFPNGDEFCELKTFESLIEDILPTAVENQYYKNISRY